MREAWQVAGSIRASLHKIRDHYAAADTRTQRIDESGIHAHADDTRIPINAVGMSAQQDALRDLHLWAGTVQRLLALTHTPRTNLGALTAFLDAQAEQLAQQHPSDAGLLDDDLARHANRLEALANGWEARRIRIEPCPAREIVDQPDGTETSHACAGTLWAVMREADNGLLPRVVACDVWPDEHSWAPHEWVHLGRMLGTTNLLGLTA